MRKFFRFIVVFFILFIFGFGVFFSYLNIRVTTPSDPFVLGTTFSWKYSENLGLDWKKVYAATLDDLGVRKIRVPVYWDYIEKEMGVYNWDKLDYIVQEASKRDASLTLALGQKVPRWPECFLPEWAKEDDTLRKKRLLEFIPLVIDRYKSYPSVERWQVENEPFLEYGDQCPEFEVDFLDQEIAVARASDPTRDILTTDSGEVNFWVQPAKRGDVFGTTMYRTVYTEKYGYWEYPLGPRFFQVKRGIIRLLAKQNNAIVIELQTEPWLAGWVADFSVEDQLASMDAHRLRDNIEYARQSGFQEIYTWGVEWWYYLKHTEDESSLWDAAKDLFAQSQQS